MTSFDRFSVPVRSAVKSNLTDWCFQNLSKRALNALKKLELRQEHIHMHTIRDKTHAVQLTIGLI